MIICTIKPLPELVSMTEAYKKILAVGCGTCATVCLAGGMNEVSLIATALQIARHESGMEIDIRNVVLKRQCERAFVESLEDVAGEFDAILSFGCAAGIRQLVDLYDIPVLSAVNTQFIGMRNADGAWIQSCIGCGQCDTHLTAGYCVLAFCPKNMRNEPCGAETESGMCEVNPAQPCIWNTIYARRRRLGSIVESDAIIPPKKWSESLSKGLRIIPDGWR